MKGNPKVVESLQSAAALEAQLAAQYHLDKLDLKFYGLRGLAEKFNEFGEDAERWLKKVSNRILDLGGRPSYSAGAVQTRDGMGAILAGAVDSETALIAAYNEAGPAARAANDNGTGHRIDHLIKYHEAHVEYLERMAGQLADLGDKGFKGAYVAEK
jgi:bacterioferritin (cytochrome b1)